MHSEGYSIRVSGLSKRFGKFVAVDNVSFDVAKGSIFGFLGANGAGKSTTIKMLCGLLEPTSGTAAVAGFDIVKEPESVKRNIGYMSQKFSLYDDLTVAENLKFFGGVYGLSDAKLKSRMNWAIEMAGLVGRENSLARELAGGWKQRLALGCAILHEPQIVFLDEPTGGVDPISRRAFWELINTLSDGGTTVFVTTHYLDEAEYCNNIMLIYSGRIIAGGSPKLLKSEHIKNRMFEVECSDIIEALTALQKENWVIETTIFGMYLHVSVKNEIDGKEKIVSFLDSINITVKRIDRITPSLEDVFIHLIEKENR
jgi:ABC-2 type transport system ATP-binding protein